MPIEHVVFLKLKPVTAAQWQPIEAAFMALKDKCGGILNLSIGPNISPERAGGFTHALRVEFQDEKALRTYGPHEAHEHFKTILPHDLVGSPSGKPISICLDYFVK